MDRTINKIFIGAPASSATTSRSYEFLNGELIIPRCNEGEKINIVVVIGKGKSTNSAEWSSILTNKTPQTKQKSAFVITKEDWLTSGLIWVIPTSIAETTPIKILFGKNSLLESGFTIEIYCRDTIITREVAASVELTTGATISFAINWTTAVNAALATPVVETAV